MNDEDRLQAVLRILSNVPEYAPGHHMGRPFLSAYQIAIRFAEQFPDDPDVIRLPVGGAGIGVTDSLAKSLAHFLSVQIKGGENRVEGGFISHDNLRQMTFTNGNDEINVSTLDSKSAHSIFRFVGPMAE